MRGKEALVEENIHVEDEFYILATFSIAEKNRRVLKEGETFAVFDQYGDVLCIGKCEQGLFHEGTRFLSRLELRLGNNRPLLLSSTIRETNEVLAVDLTNLDILVDDQVLIQRGTLHIFRSKFLWQGASFERIRVSNYGLTQVKAGFSLRFDADFVDIFEVRGMVRERRGKRLEDRVEESRVILSYEGLDGKVRQTHIEFSPWPDGLTSSEACFNVELEPQQTAVFFMTVYCTCGPGKYLPQSYQSAWAEAGKSLKSLRCEICKIHTSHEQFNEWLDRSQADLYMMLTKTSQGIYPYAGVPWFSTAFGRDGIITALQMLWVDPDIARGVLAFLAFTQAKENNPGQDAEPGKILHEIRKGEMAELGEIPFGRYYGTVDATPLFIILAGAYYERSADREFIESIWPNIESALEWIDTYGDVDGDGFVEYQRHIPEGLVNQGWKDSHDSIFHADGTMAQGPIALCEVQGYVYDAKRRAAQLASVLGYTEAAARLMAQAQALKERFEKTFWCEDLSIYALALDGNKKPCRVRTSNAGHCLFSGIASKEHARRTAESLLDNTFFSGWGIRTVADTEKRYNPMSYHNGSIWPHDNSLIAYGLSRYKLNGMIPKIMTGLLDATLSMDLHRMPELFCGFVRRPGEGPTLYPVACAPQSWAIGSVFLLLQACLGLSVNANEGNVCFCHPFLPDFLEEVEIKNLRVGKASVDLLLRRHIEDVGVMVLRREGAVGVTVIK
ncbi:MAG: amylo-alpha-1,6-glucosidase [bacterium]